MIKIRTALFLAATATAGLTAGQASATVAYNVPLVAPGTYFGSGNPNTNWTTDTENGVEVGLQTLIRYTGPVVAPTPTNSAIYHVATGINVVHGGTLWDFAFSFNGNIGATTITLDQITTQLTFFDVGNNSPVSFDPLSTIPDNDKFGPGGKNSNSDSLATQYGFQNAETPSFFAVALGDTNFSAFQDDTYLVTFTATCKVGATACTPGETLGSISETIVAGAGASVPEPASAAMLVIGCMGLLHAKRRRAA